MAPDWKPMDSAPRDGTPIDVLFDPHTAERDAKGSMAEFYAPGSTRRRKPADPLIPAVIFERGHFRVPGCYAIMSVRLTHWRPASNANRWEA